MHPYMSVRQRLERAYLKKPGHQAGCVLAGSFPKPRTGSDVWWDYSPQKNHSTITGAVWTRLSSGLWVLDLDGSDDMVVTKNNIGISGNDSWTQVGWVKSDNFTSSAKCAFGFLSTQSNDTGRNTIMHHGSKWQIFTYYDAGYVLLNTSIAATTNWTLLCFYHDGTIKVRVYESGAVSTYSNPAGAKTLAVIDDKYSIGTYAGTASSPYPWAGLLGLNRVYTRALSIDEMDTIFNRERHLFGV